MGLSDQEWIFLFVSWWVRGAMLAGHGGCMVSKACDVEEISPECLAT